MRKSKRELATIVDDAEEDAIDPGSLEANPYEYPLPDDIELAPEVIAAAAAVDSGAEDEDGLGIEEGTEEVIRVCERRLAGE